MIFCTELFRVLFVGCVDVCCFDKMGTITAENFVLEGVVSVKCVLLFLRLSRSAPVGDPDPNPQVLIF